MTMRNIAITILILFAFAVLSVVLAIIADSFTPAHADEVPRVDSVAIRQALPAEGKSKEPLPMDADGDEGSSNLPEKKQ